MASSCRATGRPPRISSRQPASALERAHQFQPGTRLDRWLFAILRSIWLNDLRAKRFREGAGTADAAEVLTFDGAGEIETNITAARVLTEVQGLPEAQRETVFLVYVEGLTYAEAALRAGNPDRHGDEPAGGGAVPPRPASGTTRNGTTIRRKPGAAAGGGERCDRMRRGPFDGELVAYLTRRWIRPSARPWSGVSPRCGAPRPARLLAAGNGPSRRL